MKSINVTNSKCTWTQKSPLMVPGLLSAGFVSPSITRPAVKEKVNKMVNVFQTRIKGGLLVRIRRETADPDLLSTVKEDRLAGTGRTK